MKNLSFTKRKNHVWKETLKVLGRKERKIYEWQAKKIYREKYCGIMNKMKIKMNKEKNEKEKLKRERKRKKQKCDWMKN